MRQFLLILICIMPFQTADGQIFRFDFFQIQAAQDAPKSFIISEPELNNSTDANQKIVIDEYFENKTRIKSGPNQYDSRIELNQLDTGAVWEKKILNNAFSVGLIIEKEYVDRVSEEIYLIELTTNLENRYGICPSEPFSNQYSIGIGTAFLIGKDTMMTAAHVFERPLDQYYIVFGFQLSSLDAKSESIFHKDDVVQLDKMIYDYNVEDYDLAVFKLKNESNRIPLQMDNTFIEKVNTPVYAIGHPLGIPKKVSLNARIIDNKKENNFFYTSLDAFQGNSGSPVFNFQNNKVIGVLVSGEIDFEERGGCLESKQCKPPFCKGEKIVKISVMGNK